MDHMNRMNRGTHVPVVALRPGQRTKADLVGYVPMTASQQGAREVMMRMKARGGPDPVWVRWDGNTHQVRERLLGDVPGHADIANIVAHRAGGDLHLGPVDGVHVAICVEAGHPFYRQRAPPSTRDAILHPKPTEVDIFEGSDMEDGGDGDDDDGEVVFARDAGTAPVLFSRGPPPSSREAVLFGSRAPRPVFDDLDSPYPQVFDVPRGGPVRLPRRPATVDDDADLEDFFGRGLGPFPDLGGSATGRTGRTARTLGGLASRRLAASRAGTRIRR